jgi:hypothetical protein
LILGGKAVRLQLDTSFAKQMASAHAREGLKMHRFYSGEHHESMDNGRCMGQHHGRNDD